jgi:hypothetical protein
MSLKAIGFEVPATVNDATRETFGMSERPCFSDLPATDGELLGFSSHLVTQSCRMKRKIRNQILC